jgi:hypothetical protein
LKSPIFIRCARLAGGRLELVELVEEPDLHQVRQHQRVQHALLEAPGEGGEVVEVVGPGENAAADDQAPHPRDLRNPLRYDARHAPPVGGGGDVGELVVGEQVEQAPGDAVDHALARPKQPVAEQQRAHGHAGIENAAGDQEVGVVEGVRGGRVLHRVSAPVGVENGDGVIGHLAREVEGNRDRRLQASPDLRAGNGAVAVVRGVVVERGVRGEVDLRQEGRGIRVDRVQHVVAHRQDLVRELVLALHDEVEGEHQVVPRDPVVLENREDLVGLGAFRLDRRDRAGLAGAQRPEHRLGLDAVAEGIDEVAHRDDVAVAGNQAHGGPHEQDLPLQVGGAGVDFEPVEDALAGVGVDQDRGTVGIERAGVVGAHVLVRRLVQLAAAARGQQARGVRRRHVHAGREVHQDLHRRAEAIELVEGIGQQRVAREHGHAHLRKRDLQCVPRPASPGRGQEA